MPQPKSVHEQKSEDDYVWVIASVVLFLLARLFFTPLPYLALWLGAGMTWHNALGFALVIGYTIELVVRRWLHAIDV